MTTEEAIALVVAEINPQRTLYGLSALLGVAFIHSLWMQWKVNAPKREQAKMNAEREKVAKKTAADHIFGALQYAVKDGQLTAEEAGQIIRDIGKRVLPDLLPDGATLKEDLLAKKGEVAKVASNVLSLMRAKLT